MPPNEEILSRIACVHDDVRELRADVKAAITAIAAHTTLLAEHTRDIARLERGAIAITLGVALTVLVDMVRTFA
jgi:hypothetical protein